MIEKIAKFPQSLTNTVIQDYKIDLKYSEELFATSSKEGFIIVSIETNSLYPAFLKIFRNVLKSKCPEPGALRVVSAKCTCPT